MVPLGLPRIPLGLPGVPLGLPRAPTRCTTRLQHLLRSDEMCTTRSSGTIECSRAHQEPDKREI